uniref:G-protein coupled receptors family 1 profile domain-containing protein n=1 Tax=Sinocyclocheilus grahami TaxID=75366 RepID=A0A672K8R0_SINGR
METPRSPFNTTSDSDLYSITAEPNYYNRSRMNNYYTEFTVPASIIASIEIPMICLAIYAVYSLIKSKQAAPVFVINLLISDLIQIVCTLLLNASLLFSYIIIWAGSIGLYFMTCIAVERYVLIAHPVWHRSHRSVKCFVCTSLTGWLIPFIVCLVCFFINELVYIMPFIPYLVIIVCFVGTCRSLSHSISLTPVKQQLALAPLFFVVISYTFLILPLQICIFLLLHEHEFPLSLFIFTFILYLLNPLVDCLLYVFMRSDIEKIIRMPHCCSRLKRVQTETGQTTSTDVQCDHV